MFTIAILADKRFTPGDREFVGQRVVLREYHQILAVPPYARHDEAIATKEGTCGTDLLSAAIVATAKLGGGNAEFLKVES